MSERYSKNEAETEAAKMQEVLHKLDIHTKSETVNFAGDVSSKTEWKQQKKLYDTAEKLAESSAEIVVVARMERDDMVKK